MKSGLKTKVDDHSLESVPDIDRKSWLSLTWNTAGIVTTLVLLFFGALVCFVAGVKIALIAGFICFGIGGLLGWGLSRIAYTTGLSNTLLTRQFGLGIKGSALASIIFSFLIIGMLAVENALLYRGILFFLEIPDTASTKILIFGLLTIVWILVTTFGFELVSRFSSLMLISFLLVMGWMLSVVLAQADTALANTVMFGSQLPAPALQSMGIESDWDKFVFSMNILIGPACALPLVSVDYGRYAKSTLHATTAVVIGNFFQVVVMTIVGGVLMYAAAEGLTKYFVDANGISMSEARQLVLNSPDSIAATFMVFGGVTGFVLMIVAQAKAQVLNCYSSSLSLTNLFDALFGWRPGRFVFVILANVLALMMLYGHILELVEAWIGLLGVLLSTLSGTILLDYFVVKPYLARNLASEYEQETVNWAGVLSIIGSVVTAHYLLAGIVTIEALTSSITVVILYPLLRLYVIRPKVSYAELEV